MKQTLETPFLQAIAAEHDSDEPRLVFADWLEERGDVRGEFIRVQCELSQDNSNERHVELAVRERAILNAHRRDWLGTIPLALEDVRYRRGVLNFLDQRSFLRPKL